MSVIVEPFTTLKFSVKVHLKQVTELNFVLWT